LHDHFRIFGGVNLKDEANRSPDNIHPTAILGIRYFTPYMFHLDVRIDNELRPKIDIHRDLMIFHRTFLFGDFEYQADFGWVNDLTDEITGDPVNFRDEIVWSTGLAYMLGRYLSLKVSYDNRFGFGGGVSAMFDKSNTCRIVYPAQKQ
jgi:hypothetical protein